MKKVFITGAMLGMIGGAYAADFYDLAVKTGGLEALAAADAVAVPKVSKDYVEGNEPSPIKPVEWVTISGGKFSMGTDSAGMDFEASKPVHEVAIKTFEMSKTAVTVEQYAECVNKGQCTRPDIGEYCNWGKTGRQLHPINCVDWHQANQYAKFAGGRLPSESEWEYAATSGGNNHKYPWGNADATCDKVVGGKGCASDGTMPVCSKPAGNTAQGLCDMAGNVWQWVQDKYNYSYKDAPADGSAFEGAGIDRVIRGGSFGSILSLLLRADYRGFSEPGSICFGVVGIRLARSL